MLAHWLPLAVPLEFAKNQGQTQGSFEHMNARLQNEDAIYKKHVRTKDAQMAYINLYSKFELLFYRLNQNDIVDTSQGKAIEDAEERDRALAMRLSVDVPLLEQRVRELEDELFEVENSCSVDLGELQDVLTMVVGTLADAEACETVVECFSDAVNGIWKKCPIWLKTAFLVVIDPFRLFIDDGDRADIGYLWSGALGTLIVFITLNVVALVCLKLRVIWKFACWCLRMVINCPLFRLWAEVNKAFKKDEEKLEAQKAKRDAKEIRRELAEIRKQLQEAVEKRKEKASTEQEQSSSEKEKVEKKRGPITCTNCGQTGHGWRMCPQPQRCYWCGSKTHLYKDCSRKKRGLPRMTIEERTQKSDDGRSQIGSVMGDDSRSEMSSCLQDLNERLKELEDDTHSDVSLAPRGSECTVNAAMGAGPSEKKRQYKIKGRLNDGPLRSLLIDTGAEYNIIPTKLAEQMGLALREAEHSRVVGYDGSPQVVKGVAKIKTTIGSQLRELDFLVVDVDLLIVGDPGLQSYEMQIVCREEDKHVKLSDGTKVLCHVVEGQKN